MGRLIHDVKTAVRMLALAPGFTLLAVVTLALGIGANSARAGDVVRMVVGHGVLLAVLGIVLGIGGALALSRLLVGLLYGVSATEPAVYATMAGLFVAVVALASWLPARRAARVDPMVALRSE